MSPDKLGSYRRKMERLWVLSPERLWLASIGLQQRGHWVLAFWLKQLNTMLYRNSLAPGASVSPDISLGHSSFGIVVNANVIIGERVKIHHNVTLTLRTGGAPVKLTIEDDVKIGANAVIIGPRGRSLRIGRGARIGAGTVVTHDVPAGATVVSAPPRVLLKGARDSDPAAHEQAAESPRVEAPRAHAPRAEPPRAQAPPSPSHPPAAPPRAPTPPPAHARSPQESEQARTPDGDY